MRTKKRDQPTNQELLNKLSEYGVSLAGLRHKRVKASLLQELLDEEIRRGPIYRPKSYTVPDSLWQIILATPAFWDAMDSFAAFNNMHCTAKCLRLQGQDYLNLMRDWDLMKTLRIKRHVFKDFFLVTPKGIDEVPSKLIDMARVITACNGWQLLFKRHGGQWEQFLDSLHKRSHKRFKHCVGLLADHIEYLYNTTTGPKSRQTIKFIHEFNPRIYGSETMIQRVMKAVH